MATRTVVRTGSSTVTVTRGPHLVLVTPKAHAVAWTPEVVDNEHAGKRSSKRCCIYHKPKAWDADDSDDSDSSHSGDEGGPVDSSALPHGGGHACGGCGAHDSDGEADEAHARPQSKKGSDRHPPDCAHCKYVARMRQARQTEVAQPSADTRAAVDVRGDGQEAGAQPSAQPHAVVLPSTSSPPAAASLSLTPASS